MKWYSIKKHKPPMEVVCFVFTRSNYFYLARLDDSEDFSVWNSEVECDECGCSNNVIYGVTHFCIPEPVELDE